METLVFRVFQRQDFKQAVFAIFIQAIATDATLGHLIRFAITLDRDGQDERVPLRPSANGTYVPEPAKQALRR